jgi:hypothetical protein
MKLIVSESSPKSSFRLVICWTVQQVPRKTQFKDDDKDDFLHVQLHYYQCLLGLVNRFGAPSPLTYGFASDHEAEI